MEQMLYIDENYIDYDYYMEAWIYGIKKRDDSKLYIIVAG